MTNTNPVSDHEAAIINSSFSEWLLWVIVFTYTAIDIVKDIMTGICVVIAIIGTFIKNKKIFVDKVNYDMVNKVCGCGQSISIVTRYWKPVTVRKSPPTPDVINNFRVTGYLLIRRSPVNSPHKGQWRGALMFFFDLRLNKRLSKQWWGWWFETS